MQAAPLKGPNEHLAILGCINLWMRLFAGGPELFRLDAPFGKQVTYFGEEPMGCVLDVYRRMTVR